MKKILFIVVMMLSFCVNANAQIFNLSDAEKDYLKACVSNGKAPIISYVSGSYIFSTETNDYVKHKDLSLSEKDYYKNLNILYKDLKKISIYPNAIDDYFNDYKKYQETVYIKKLDNRITAGGVLMGAGALVIIGGEIGINNIGEDSDLDIDDIRTIRNVTLIAGGVMTITGIVLTVDAINKRNHLLKVSTNGVSYSYKF